MPILSIRRIALLFAVVGLSGFTVYLAQDDWAHRRISRDLAREAARLQNDLDTVETRHRALIDDIEKEKNDLKDALERLRSENEDLRSMMDRVRAEAKKAVEEKAYLEEILINKSKENGRLKKGPGYADSAWTGDSAELIEQIKKKDKELRTLEEQNRLLGEKIEKLYNTTNTKINEINVAKIALEETVASARQKIEEEWNTVNLGAISSRDGSTPQRLPAGRQAPSRLPRTEGKVLAVNDQHGFVVVDLGRVDNLQTQQELEVVQNGETVATLSVLEIRDVMAACNVRDIADGGRIQVNDPVSVRRAAETPAVRPIF